jgi:hypothetical protein
MTTRPDSVIVVLGESVTKQIQDHANAFSTLWYEVPQTIHYGPSVADIDSPRPVVIVSIGEIFDDLNETLGLFLSRATVEIHCAVKNSDDPEGALHNLCADIFRALMSNRELEGTTFSNIGAGGYLAPDGYVPSIAIDNNGGDGVALMKFVATMTRSTDTP